MPFSRQVKKHHFTHAQVVPCQDPTISVRLGRKSAPLRCRCQSSQKCKSSTKSRKHTHPHFISCKTGHPCPSARWRPKREKATASSNLKKCRKPTHFTFRPMLVNSGLLMQNHPDPSLARPNVAKKRPTAAHATSQSKKRHKHPSLSRSADIHCFLVVFYNTPHQRKQERSLFTWFCSRCTITCHHLPPSCRPAHSQPQQGQNGSSHDQTCAPCPASSTSASTTPCAPEAAGARAAPECCRGRTASACEDFSPASA